jgi:hypothetical protein
MLLLKILTSGLGPHRPRLDLGLVLAILWLIATGTFVYSAGTRGQAALRVELADLNVRQADVKNDIEELSSALAQVTARLAALETDAGARQLPGIPADVLETGSLADGQSVETARNSKRKVAR